MAKPTDESSDASSAPQSKNTGREAEQVQPEVQPPEKTSDKLLDIEGVPSESPPGEGQPSHEPRPPETVAAVLSDHGSLPEEQLSRDDGPEFLTAEGLDPAAVALQMSLDQNDDDVSAAAALVENIDEDALLQQVAGVFLLWWHWAYFEVTITSPSLPVFNPPTLINPAPIAGTDDSEFVYDILDSGNKLSTSKGEEMYSVGMSMCKMYYTIEKIIFILVERLKNSGISTDTEVQVTFDGHLLGQRKAFESIINLNYNVIVTNFDPGAWGERYLDIVKRMADKGYGYPPEAPRDLYKVSKKKATGPKH